MINVEGHVHDDATLGKVVLGCLGKGAEKAWEKATKQQFSTASTSVHAARFLTIKILILHSHSENLYLIYFIYKYIIYLYVSICKYI